jgi:hypothetical protein
MDPYQNNDNQDSYNAGGNIYGTAQNQAEPVYPNESMSQNSSQMGIDMTQPYQPPPQNTNQQAGMGPQGFLTVQKSPSRMALVVVAGVVFVAAVGAVGGMLYLSYGSSQADESIQQFVTPPPQENDQAEQSSQGLTVEDSIEISPENEEARDMEPAVNEYVLEDDEVATESSAVTDEAELSLISSQEDIIVGEPYTITLSYTPLTGITAFDILVYFDPQAFDISEKDIVSVQSSFDVFAFYKKHDDESAHVTISGVRSPGEDTIEEGTILEVTFIPTESGNHEFSVLDSFDTESTKFVNSEDETIIPRFPEPVSVHVGDEK